MVTDSDMENIVVQGKYESQQIKLEGDIKKDPVLGMKMTLSLFEPFPVTIKKSSGN